MCRGIFTYIDNLDKSTEDISSTTFGDARNHWENRLKKIKEMEGKENPYQLHKDLGDIMMGSVLIVRDNKKLEKTVQKIDDIKTRFKDVNCVDTADWANPGTPVHLPLRKRGGRVLRGRAHSQWAGVRWSPTSSMICYPTKEGT